MHDRSEIRDSFGKSRKIPMSEEDLAFIEELEAKEDEIFG